MGRVAVCAGVLLVALTCRQVRAEAPPEDAADIEHFRTRVEPLLRSKCFSCHGPEKQEGGLRLDSREAVFTGGASGAAAEGAQPEDSLLVQAVRHAKGAPAMPPEEKLGNDEIAALVRWIDRGAVWSTADTQQSAILAGPRRGDAFHDPENPIVIIFGGKRLDLWSLKHPVRPPVPAVRNTAKVRTAVDMFILAPLEAAGLGLAPEADRRTLFRRLSFTLLGLPPAPEEIEAFVHDDSPAAYERAVERLLADPNYGEQQARHWLDVVRYADTNGHERDEFRPQMYRYRDYVIRSFSADKPYDEFIREQLAGDELASQPPRDAADTDRLVATGFLRLGTFDSTAPLFQEEAKSRNELMADVVNTTGSAFLGLTLSCANCHDHKYDPVSQADHFRLRAFFAAVIPRDDVRIDTADVQQAVEQFNSVIESDVEQLRQQVADILGPARRIIAEKRRGAFPDEIKALLAIDESQRDEVAKEKLKPFLAMLNVKDDDALAESSDDVKARHTELAQQISGVSASKREFTTAATMVDASAQAPVTHLFYQGDFHEPRQEIVPGFLSYLDPNPADVPPLEGRDTTGRRAALAEWIASPHNPFTARVVVNRLWRQSFGRGIVSTPNDFGYSGAQPTHPELLDWLAAELVEHNWSLKHVQRLILLSATFRQASAPDSALQVADPDNRLFSRQNIQRLSAETMRDAMLAVSGRLLPQRSGQPRWPPVPYELLFGQPGIQEALKGEDGGRRQGYYAEPVEQTDVRSVFLIQKRGLPLPYLQAFDLPELTTSCGRRDVTTVAPQALSLLNSPFAVRMARAFAERVAREAGEQSAPRVECAVRLALGRALSENERTVALDLLARHQQMHSERPLAAAPGSAEAASDDSHGLPVEDSRPPEDPALAALADLCLMLMNLNEFVYVD
jgi:mono/diheme cytochrome c family protein